MSPEVASVVYAGDYDAIPGIVQHHLPELGIDGIGLVALAIRLAAQHRVTKHVGHAQLSARFLAANGIGRNRGIELKRVICTLFPDAFMLIPGTPTTPEQLRFDRAALAAQHNAWMRTQGRAIEHATRAAPVIAEVVSAPAPAPAPQPAVPAAAPVVVQEQPAPVTEAPAKTKKPRTAKPDTSAERAEMHHRILAAWNDIKGRMPGRRARKTDGRYIADKRLARLIDEFVTVTGGEEEAIETLRRATVVWNDELDRLPGGWLERSATIELVFSQGHSKGGERVAPRQARVQQMPAYVAPDVI